jgi:osmotically-inducible protein OsmY
VTNLITVRPRVRTSPEELQRRIEEALVRSAETDAERIVTEVDGDKVILKGTVRSWAERRRRSGSPGPRRVWPRSRTAS